ncbi:MAG: peptidylprolyl isomerase [Clostridia bacterium]|nr:peptidylprolyl isomerase [Clostridia bacterium]
MNMKKLLCMVLALLLALSALALAEDGDLQAQLDAANARIAELEAEVELYRPYYERQIVAEYGDGGIIWLDDAMEEYEAAASAYTQYGLSIDDYADYVKQSILENLVQQAVLDEKAAELGLTELDEEAQANLEAEAAENFETYITTYTSYFAEEGATEEEAREQTIAALEQYGMTLDTLVEQLRDSYVSEQLFNHVTEGITVDETEIQAAYEAMVSANETDFADDRAYNNARNNGETIAWNPEGYRAVKHVLVKFDDDQAATYSALQSTLSSLNAEMEALDAPAEEAEEAEAEAAETEAEAEEEAEPRTREEIQADIAQVAMETEALYSQLLPKAQEVIDAFEGGADFDSLMEKYGEDPGMQREPNATIGYAVAETSTTWEDAFTEGAMSIEAVGQISAPVYGSNGIHIIYYMADIVPGAVPFEEIAAEAEASALDTKVNDTYNAQVAAWVEEAAPVYHLDRF